MLKPVDIPFTQEQKDRMKEVDDLAVAFMKCMTKNPNIENDPGIPIYDIVYDIADIIFAYGIKVYYPTGAYRNGKFITFDCYNDAFKENET